MTQTIAYLDCHSGISGDMFLGAMLDAGLSFAVLKDALASLPLQGYELSLESFVDKGIQGSRFHVVLSDKEQPPRHLPDIVEVIKASTLAPPVHRRALNIFRRLAEAEATVHGTSIEEVHFHEVGAVDAIIDIVGAALALEMLEITQVYASPLPLTTGHVKTAHGLLPIPAPATLEILRRVPALWQPRAAEGELVTPTGAALLAEVARFEMPPIAIERVGYGFGQKSFPWPNCLRVCLGHTTGTAQANNPTAALDTDWVSVIETNIDTMSGEMLGDLMNRLLAAGALDVGYIPMQMKKNRPATLVMVICRLEDGENLASLLLGETSTLGVRMQQMQRRKAHRALQHIETPLGTLVVKVKRLGERIISAAPEYEECRRIAQAHHLPLQEVYEVAQRTIERLIIEERI